MITKKELKQLFRWTGIWIWGFFIALTLREWIMTFVTNKFHLILIGIGGMLVWAHIFDLTKYSG